MREASISRTVTDTDSYAFFFYITTLANEGMTAALDQSYTLMLKFLRSNLRLLPMLLFLTLLGASPNPLSARDFFTYTYEGQTVYYTVIDEYTKTCKTREGTYSSPGHGDLNGSLILPEHPMDGDTEYNLVEIGKYSFCKSTGLTSVTIPSSVTTIGNGAFDCSGLASVIIPNSVTTIGGSAFSMCSGLASVTIPNSVTTIGGSAFSMCSGLTSVTIPNSVTTIKAQTFFGCSGLTSISIPSSVTAIGDNAFLGCFGLTKAEFASVEALCSIEFGYGANPLEEADNLYINGREVKNLIIPSSVTAIGNYAFYGCDGITSVVIPSSVITIGYDAFWGCSGLMSVTIPNSVTTIGGGAFGECSGLTSVTISESVTTIGSGAFGGCANLTSVDIPSSVTTIESYAFRDCSGLTSVTIPSSVIYFDGSAFLGCELRPLRFERKLAEDEEIWISLESGSVVLCHGSDVNKFYSLYGCSIYPFDSPYRYNASKLTNGVKMSAIENPYFDGNVEWGNIRGVVYDSNNEAVRSIDIEGDPEYVITGLQPEKSYILKIMATDENNASQCLFSYSFETPEVTFTTLNPKCVSSTCAIVAAETNISDLEPRVGFQWKKYDAPATLAPKEAYAAVNDGVLEGYIRNLQPTSYYDVRPFYKDADDNYYYGEWVTFDPSDFSYFEPTVKTYPVQNMTASTVTVRGYALAGTDNIKRQGFQYWKTGSVSAQDFHTMATPGAVNTVEATGQIMTATLENLEPGTTYTYRAFVETDAGHTYGEEHSFTTEEGQAGIGVIGDDEVVTVVGYFDLAGRRYDKPQRGFNIVVYSNGTTKKMLY